MFDLKPFLVHIFSYKVKSCLNVFASSMQYWILSKYMADMLSMRNEISLLRNLLYTKIHSLREHPLVVSWYTMILEPS